VLRIEKDTDIRHILPAVRVPTLVLTRTGDQSQPIEGGRYIAAKIPGARFVRVARQRRGAPGWAMLSLC
jgi:pimeloyl-ACP methyl ester carboxylesterase